MDRRSKSEIRSAKRDRLRDDIRKGLASGPSEPHDMAAIKAEARAGYVRRKP